MRNILFLFSFLFVACNQNGKKNHSYSDIRMDSSLSIKVGRLSVAFKENNYTVFFDQFPETFIEFIQCYGYDEEEGASPLYNESYSHIHFLFNCPNEVNFLLVQKVVNIAIKAKWEADAVNYFQAELLNLIEKYPGLVLDELKKRSISDCAHFWHFVFDGSGKFDTQNNIRYQRLLKIVKSIDIEQSNILYDEFEKMY